MLQLQNVGEKKSNSNNNYLTKKNDNIYKIIIIITGYMVVTKKDKLTLCYLLYEAYKRKRLIKKYRKSKKRTGYFILWVS